MLEIKFKCQCIKDCPVFGTEAGDKYDGLVVFDDDTKETTIVIDIPEDYPIKCVSTWFVDYFKIIEC